MKREFVLNSPGSIQTLSKEEFLEAVEERDIERAQFTAMTRAAEPDDDEDDDDDDDGGEEVTANAQELREIRGMLGLDAEKSKPENDERI